MTQKSKISFKKKPVEAKFVETAFPNKTSNTTCHLRKAYILVVYLFENMMAANSQKAQ